MRGMVLMFWDRSATHPPASDVAAMRSAGGARPTGSPAHEPCNLQCSESAPALINAHRNQERSWSSSTYGQAAGLFVAASVSRSAPSGKVTIQLRRNPIPLIHAGRDGARDTANQRTFVFLYHPPNIETASAYSHVLVWPGMTRMG